MRRVYGLAAVAGMMLVGCGGGPGSTSLSNVPPPSPATGSGTLVLRLGSGTVHRIDRILGDTTSFSIVVTDAQSGTQLATANPSLAQLQSGSGNVTVNVPLETSPEAVNVVVTSTNRYGANTGYFAGNATMSVDQDTPFSAVLARHYTNADLNGTLAFDLVVDDPGGTGGGGSGTIELDGAGHVGGGSLTVESNGLPAAEALGAGNYTVNQDGSFTLSTSLQESSSKPITVVGHLDSSKDVAVISMQSTDTSGRTVQGWGGIVSTIGPFSDANLGPTVGVAANQEQGWAQFTLDTDSNGTITGDNLVTSGGINVDIDSGSYSVASSTGLVTATFTTSDNNTQTIPILGNTVMSSGLDVLLGTGGLENMGALLLGVDLSSGHTAGSLNGTYGIHLLRSQPLGNAELGTLSFDGVSGVTGSINTLNFPTPPSLTSLPAATSVSGTYTVQPTGQVSFTYQLNGVTETFNGFVNPRNNVASGIMTDASSGAGTFGMVQVSP
ncbi:MAG TPA: hypothetical protein VGO93_29955 [Candidatus Xenobia bacterium]|jgi:hypothetical protein